MEMGKQSYPPHFQHFSHAHPLELSNFQQVPNFLCSGCKLEATGLIYYCKYCTYALHVACSQMPQHINHPAHTQHPLTLLPTPSYPGGIFNCDACGQKDNTGFSYSCSCCNVDIHILCATSPLSVNHQTHPHPLNLSLFPPYEKKCFSCDICKEPGLNHWLYRCNLCTFDAHLSCATAQHQHQHQPLLQPQQIQFEKPQLQSQSQPQQFFPQVYPPGAQVTGICTDLQQVPPQYQSQQVYPPGATVAGICASPQQVPLQYQSQVYPLGTAVAGICAGPQQVPLQYQSQQVYPPRAAVAGICAGPQLVPLQYQSPHVYPPGAVVTGVCAGPQQFPPQYQSPQVYPPGAVVEGIYAGPHQPTRSVSSNSMISSRNVKSIMKIGSMLLGG
ncbi:hypothetical protein GIB67_006045 [Kingdonia uniflora]|uniref:DC1 domain-containing protein n=1 Tax=Kingdonia uniflora TaxID=39325 RepID=A0A7J7LPK3_9MAGN|nr:hypothetical protein GIB67_006045 [Kingdonia uniflora]